MIENVEAIKASVSIDKIIGQYLQLKPDGHHLLALCPFHTEKTPSFTVTPEKAMYKCFGCDVGGDVFSFVKEMEKTTFADAVKRVAEMSGIPVIESADAPVKPKPPQANGNGVHKNGNLPQSVPATKPTSTALNESKPKLVATYPYTTASGEFCYEVLRYEPGKNGKKKDFRQRRPFRGAWAWGLNAGWYQQSERGDWYSTSAPGEGAVELPEVLRVLYKLPDLPSAYEVLVPEGEKDVDTLVKLGFVATTNSGGSQQPWMEEYSEALRGKRVIVLPDNDASGEPRGRKIEQALKNIASEIVYVQMPKGFKDVTEYVDAGKTAEDIVRLVQTVEEGAAEAACQHRGLLTPNEVISRFRGGLGAFLDPKNRPKGIPTGFIKFDTMTGGLYDGDLFILAARPSMGKTAMALDIAVNVAIEEAKKENARVVAIFSLEMSAASLLDRMTCSRASIDYLRFRSGNCSPTELYAFRDAIAYISELPIVIDDSPYLTIEELDRKLALLAEDREPSLVVIDYLQLMSGRKKVSENRVQEVSEQSRGVKLSARKYRSKFLVLSQLSRAPETRPGDHRPILSDLRDGGSIEQDADMVAFIYREEVYRPDKPHLRGIAELLLAKQRNGPIGRVKLAFVHKSATFRNLAIEAEDSPYE